MVTGVTGSGYLPTELRGPQILIVCNGDLVLIVLQAGSVEVQLSIVDQSMD